MLETEVRAEMVEVMLSGRDGAEVEGAAGPEGYALCPLSRAIHHH